MNVEPDEKAAEPAGDAPHEDIDRQLPDIVPEARTIQRNVVVVQSQVAPDTEPRIEYFAWPLVKLCQKVQSGDSGTCRQKPTPEQGCAVEGGALFD